MTATPLLDRINARKAASDRVLVPVNMAVRKSVPVPIWRQRAEAKDLTGAIYSNGSYVPRGGGDVA